MQPAIDRLSSFTAVISAKRACSRDRDEHSLRIFWIEKNRVQTHSASARLPLGPGIAPRETGQFVPRFPPSFDWNNAASSTPA
jgi:hypothetical protein